MYDISFRRLQMRKARDSQRQAEKENVASQGGAGGFKGPDGSGQWVSLGELDPNEDLDQALNSLTGGICALQFDSVFLWSGEARVLQRSVAIHAALLYVQSFTLLLPMS